MARKRKVESGIAPQNTKQLPPRQTVTILASYLRTSAGPRHHGDSVALPPDEAQQLINKGFAE